MSNSLVSSEEIISKISSNKIDQAIVEDILKEYKDSIILDNFTLSAFTEYTWSLAGREVVNRIDSNRINDYNDVFIKYALIFKVTILSTNKSYILT